MNRSRLLLGSALRETGKRICLLGFTAACLWVVWGCGGAGWSFQAPLLAAAISGTVIWLSEPLGWWADSKPVPKHRD